MQSHIDLEEEGPGKYWFNMWVVLRLNRLHRSAGTRVNGDQIILGELGGASADSNDKGIEDRIGSGALTPSNLINQILSQYLREFRSEEMGGYTLQEANVQPTRILAPEGVEGLLLEAHGVVVVKS